MNGYTSKDYEFSLGEVFIVVFGTIKLIYYIIVMTIKLIYLSIISLSKLIYLVITNFYKLIHFALCNDKLRFPTLLFTIGFITSTKLFILFTIYYLYLMHSLAKKYNIYLYIRDYIIDKYKFLNSRKLLYKNLKKLCSENKIVKDMFLENEDNLLYIDCLVVTPKALYNIISYDDTKKLDSNYIVDNISKLKGFINDVFAKDLPIINILPIENYSYNELVSDFPFKIIALENLASYIDENPYKKLNKPVNEIYSLIAENKLWLIDRFIMNFIKFVTHHKRIVLFIIFCPIVYCIYIFSLLFFANLLFTFAQNGIHKVTEVFNIF